MRAGPTNINIAKIESSHPMIDWHFGNWCQYSCSYCPAHLHSNNTEKHNLETLINFTDAVEERFSQITDNPIVFTFAGGEPTIHGNFGNFIKYLKERNHIVSVVSNGGRTVRWWEDNYQYIDSTILSFHTEFTDIEHFSKVAELLGEKGVYVDVFIIANPEKFSTVQSAYERLITIPKVNVVVKKIEYDWPMEKPVRPYTEEEIQWIDNNARYKSKDSNPNIIRVQVSNENGFTRSIMPAMIRNFEKNQFQDWKCYQGFKNLSIKIDGSVYGAHCMSTLLGNIKEPKNINWPTEPTICPFRACSCINDILIDKEK